MKTKAMILGLISVCLFATAQQKKHTYTISGNIEGLKAPYLYLYPIGGGIDSLAVQGGKFTYKGSEDEPRLVYLTDKQIFSQSFYLENSPVNINGKTSAPDDLLVTGGKTQQELNAFNVSINPVNIARKKLYKENDAAVKAKDTITMVRIKKQLKKCDDDEIALSKAFILSHSKSYVSLDKIREVEFNSDYSEVAKLYQSLDSSLKESVSGKKLETTLVGLKRGGNGQKMIDFTQNDLSGKPVSFSSFKGKYVLVDFWASWCGPCRAENPNVLKAYHRFSSKGFTVLGVSLDNDAAKWKKAVEADKLPWTQVSDLKGWKNDVSTYYGIRGIPSNYLVDPNGTIVARNLRGEELESKLAGLLK